MPLLDWENVGWPLVPCELDRKTCDTREMHAHTIFDGIDSKTKERQNKPGGEYLKSREEEECLSNSSFHAA